MEFDSRVVYQRHLDSNKHARKVKRRKPSEKEGEKERKKKMLGEKDRESRWLGHGTSSFGLSNYIWPQ